MNLGFNTPSAFAQSVRLRLNALPADSAVLVLEGKSDKQSLISFVHPTVHVVPARGKDVVLQSRAHLTGPELARVAFVVDCDGRTDAMWLTDGTTIVTSMRDLDADIALGLGTFDSYILDFVASKHDTPGDALAEATRLRDFVEVITARIGVVLDAARHLGLRVRIVDPLTSQKRRVRLSDLAELAGWVGGRHSPSYIELATAAANVVGWDPAEVLQIIEHATDGGQKSCRAHGSSECPPCLVRRFSNGHDIADVTRHIVEELSGLSIPADEVARSLRTSRTRGANWEVLRRLDLRQQLIGIPLLA